VHCCLDSLVSSVEGVGAKPINLEKPNLHGLNAVELGRIDFTDSRILQRVSLLDLFRIVLKVLFVHSRTIAKRVRAIKLTVAQEVGWVLAKFCRKSGVSFRTCVALSFLSAVRRSVRLCGCGEQTTWFAV